MDSGRKSIARRQRRGFRLPLLAALVLALLVPAVALADFGDSTDPFESPRINTPNDPDFDACEGDDEDVSQGVPAPDCSTYADEEFRAFGFSPDSANEVLPAAVDHYVTGTKYRGLPDRPAGRRLPDRPAGPRGKP